MTMRRLRPPTPFSLCWRTLLLLVLPLLAAGCGGGKGTVNGQVSYQGKPLPLGTISFISDVGRHDVANALIKDGQYTANDVSAGPNKVTVVTIDPDQSGGGAAGETASGGKDMPVAAGKKHSKNYVQIPERYANPEKSGLNLDVHTGEQPYDVKLEP
jgi:hypothetical protein